MSGTPVDLSHSIRLRPGAHTGAECVLTEPLIRATAEERDCGGTKKPADGESDGQKTAGSQKRRRNKDQKNKEGQGWGESLREEA